MKPAKRIFMAILIIIAAIILLLAIWFNIPYSSVKTQFQNDVEARLQSSATISGTLDSASIASLPPLIQKYLETSGYIGSERRSHLTMEYKNVDFGMGVNKPRIKIDYTHVDFADCRFTRKARLYRQQNVRHPVPRLRLLHERQRRNERRSRKNRYAI